MKISQLLREPFPDSTEPIDELRSISGVSLFIFLFLYLLQPFGLSEANESVFWLCLAFGAITFVVGLKEQFRCYHVAMHRNKGAISHFSLHLLL